MFIKPCAREVSSDAAFQELMGVIWANKNPVSGSPFAGRTTRLAMLMAEKLLLIVALLLTVWPVVPTAAEGIRFPGPQQCHVY